MGGVDSSGKIDLAAANKEPDRKTKNISTESDSIQIVVTTVGGSDSAKSEGRTADNVLRDVAPKGTSDSAKRGDRTADSSWADALVPDKLKAESRDSGKLAGKSEQTGDSLVSRAEVKTDGLLRLPGDSVELNKLAEQQRYQTRLRAEAKTRGGNRVGF